MNFPIMFVINVIYIRDFLKKVCGKAFLFDFFFSGDSFHFEKIID